MDQKTEQQKQRREFTKNWLNAQQSIRLFIYATINNSADAEDILQEVACQIAEKYDNYDPERPFLPWAMGVAKIKIAGYYRGQKRDGAILAGEFLESLSEACFRLHSTLHPYSVALQDCLKQLDSRSEKLLALRYDDGLNPQAIAEKLDTSSGSIRVRLNRVRNKLKTCIQSKVSSNEKTGID